MVHEVSVLVCFQIKREPSFDCSSARVRGRWAPSAFLRAPMGCPSGERAQPADRTQSWPASGSPPVLSERLGPQGAMTFIIWTECRSPQIPAPPPSRLRKHLRRLSSSAWAPQRDTTDGATYTTEMYFLTALEAGSSRSRCQLFGSLVRLLFLACKLPFSPCPYMALPLG